MTKQDLINKIEWANKRCSLKGEPLTENQKELLLFVFSDNLNNENISNPLLEQNSFCVVCGQKYLNKNKDSDTCFSCR